MTDEPKPYSDCKDSGQPWLGRIPAHWEMRRNARLFSHRVETGFPDLPVLEVSIRSGVRVREMGDGEGRKQVMSDFNKYKRACQGDIAYNMMRMWQGAVGVAPVDGLVSPAYVVARPYRDTNPAYYNHVFRTAAYMGEVNNMSRGIVSDRNRLYWDEFKQIGTPFPPPTEQSAIVRFLGALDQRVNRFVRAKRRLIELLTEQKQAIITHAVTRGLNPNAKLKPSGIDWLGDVPEHWNVRKLGQIAISFRTGPFGSILHQADYIEGGTPLVNPTHMVAGRIIADPGCSVPPATAGRLSQYRLHRNDVLFSRRGELGRCALVREADVGYLCGTGSIIARINYHGIEPEYLIQALQVGWVGKFLSLYSVGATMESLNTGILKNVPVLLPLIKEQHALLNDIATGTRAVDAAICDAHREIALIREYRTRLVADVVTGKLDVRAAAARLPDDDPAAIDEPAVMAGEEVTDEANASDDNAVELAESSADD